MMHTDSQIQLAYMNILKKSGEKILWATLHSSRPAIISAHKEKWTQDNKEKFEARPNIQNAIIIVFVCPSLKGLQQIFAIWK